MYSWLVSFLSKDELEDSDMSSSVSPLTNTSSWDARSFLSGASGELSEERGQT